ncbi:mothers against decapentaplegic homolog 6-like protein [Lates japonicus]|uniref:Mothers against decapentaplegic homolog 6-like protein n=1 Tax=Lates japonicus TaxID=270547 RepID=A0AAD3NK56_LATJO|nr:mothers against decapentaplegic homolog 6-like protein [Lates japonicus]
METQGEKKRLWGEKLQGESEKDDEEEEEEDEHKPLDSTLSYTETVPPLFSSPPHIMPRDYTDTGTSSARPPADIASLVQRCLPSSAHAAMPYPAYGASISATHQARPLPRPAHNARPHPAAMTRAATAILGLTIPQPRRRRNSSSSSSSSTTDTQEIGRIDLESWVTMNGSQAAKQALEEALPAMCTGPL